MTDANMFKGYEDGTFKPENKLTTAEAVLVALRGLGGEEIELEPTLLAAARRSLDNMLTYGG